MTMLSDDEAAEIRRSLDGGTRGPILIKWLRQLLDDRQERAARAAESERPAGTKPDQE